MLLCEDGDIGFHNGRNEWTFPSCNERSSPNDKTDDVVAPWNIVMPVPIILVNRHPDLKIIS